MLEPLNLTLKRLRDVLSSGSSQSNKRFEKLSDYAKGAGFLENNGKYWRGRRPQTIQGAEAGYQSAWLNELRKDDHIAPALELYRSSMLSKDPEWTVLENGEPIEDPDDIISAALTAWHLETGLFKELGQSVTHYLALEQIIGRIYIPESYRDELNTRTNWTLEDALSLVQPSSVDPRQGGVLKDEHKRTVGYYFAYGVKDLNSLDTVKRIELHLPKQVLTLEDKGGAFKVLEDVPSPFPNTSRRSDYLMWHAERLEGSVITDSVIDMQDSLDEVTTYMGRNDRLAGFRTIITTNAELRGEDGKPVAWVAGPGMVIDLVGVPISGTNTMGQTETALATPGWSVLDPVNPATLIASKAEYSARLKRHLSVHWEDETALAVSGVSKKESRKGFEKRVAFAAQDLGLYLAWILKAALTLAAQVMGDVKFIARVQNITFRPKLFLDIESADLETYRVLLSAWEKGAISLVSLLEATPGVSDATVELEQVKNEKRSQTENASFTARVAAVSDLFSKGVLPRSSALLELKQVGWNSIGVDLIAAVGQLETDSDLPNTPDPLELLEGD